MNCQECEHCKTFRLQYGPNPKITMCAAHLFRRRLWYSEPLKEAPEWCPLKKVVQNQHDKE